MAALQVTPQSHDRNLAEYYHWEATDRGLRIYMHSAMADRLQADVLRSVAEVGGILLGRMQQDGGHAALFIDDFIDVPSANPGKLAYDLSDAGTFQLETALLRVAQEDRESPDAPSIVGYYRSHLRDELSLSAADLQTVGSYFQDPAVIVLVKTAATTRACTAGFFFWEDGHLQSEFSSLEVALGPALHAPDAAPVPAAPSPEYTPRDNPAPPRHTLRGRMLRAGVILAAAAALVISVVAFLGSPRAPREKTAALAQAPIGLGLQVERNPPDLLVSWNRSAREIAAAQRATFTIVDGKATRIVNLDKNQLARGSYLYTPAAELIQFRLEVYDADGGSVAQSIRINR